jgi:hypothetical protein
MICYGVDMHEYNYMYIRKYVSIDTPHCAHTHTHTHTPTHNPPSPNSSPFLFSLTSSYDCLAPHDGHIFLSIILSYSALPIACSCSCLLDRSCASCLRVLIIVSIIDYYVVDITNDVMVSVTIIITSISLLLRVGYIMVSIHMLTLSSAHTQHSSLTLSLSHTHIHTHIHTRTLSL